MPRRWLLDTVDAAEKYHPGRISPAVMNVYYKVLKNSAVKGKKPMSTRQKILITEDHQMLREGLKAILGSRDDLNIVGEAADGLEAIRKIKRLQPDLMLLDLSMPRLNGLSVLADAKADQPELKILVLTIHESDRYVMEAFAAGANGYASKNDSREELLVAIDSVLSGNVYLSPSISKNVLDGFLANWKRRDPDVVWDRISQREKEILKLLAEGYTNKEIAGMLYISVKTVEKHRANIMTKLDMHNVAQLTALAVRKGLVEKKT
jgi:DNA-binding NarL/FixJ family response regulator